MTKDEALRLALEALKQIDEEMPFPVAKLAQKVIKEALAQPEHGWTPERIAGMARLKEAQDKKLAQPEQDWIERERAVGYREGHRAALAQRTWVGLTDEEVKKIVGLDRYTDLLKEVVQYVEAKLRSKNNG